MTGCGYTPAEIDEMTLHDVLALFAYWRDYPPTHEILKCVHRIERKAEVGGPRERRRSKRDRRPYRPLS